MAHYNVQGLINKRFKTNMRMSSIMKKKFLLYSYYTDILYSYYQQMLFIL